MKQLILAIILFNLSQACNAFGDNLKFKKKGNDHIWHCTKWLIDRPSLFISGVLSWTTINNQFIQNDIWHYTNEFIFLVGGMVASFFLWQLIYRSL